MGHKVGSKELQERIHLVSLMLRRKSTQFILNYAKRVWGLERGQAYNYIKDAKAEWQKYFEHLKICGKGYHTSQLRDIKDQAYRKKVVIGTGKDKKIVRTPNLPLVFDIAKEEAKLMGAYPAEEHKVDITTNFADWVKEVKKKKDDKEKSQGKSKTHGETTGKTPDVAKEDSTQSDDIKDESKTQIESTGGTPDVVVEKKETDVVEEQFII